MKQHSILRIWLALCLIFLAGCGAPAAENVETEENKAQEQEQTLTTEELQGLFEKAYEGKGNCLETPEQLAVELEEVESLIPAGISVPEDYKTQYENWRSQKVKEILESIQSGYDELIAGMPLYDYINSGVAYADFLDFDADGQNELLLVSVSPYIENENIEGWSYSIDLYGYRQGQIGPYHTDAMTLRPLYHSGFEPRTISLSQSEGRPYIHIHFEEGKTEISDDYYTVKDGSVIEADTVTALPYNEGNGYELNTGSFDRETQEFKEISRDQYDAIIAKYTDEVLILKDGDTLSPVQTRGSLSELPQEARQRAAFLEALNHDGIKYAKLLDFDNDGSTDLITVENNVFRVYRWNGSEVERISFDDMTFGMDIEGGIYRNKSTGELFLYCNDSSDGAYNVTYQFRNLSKSENISTEDFEIIYPEDVEGWMFSEKGQRDFDAALGKYEAVYEFSSWGDNRSFDVSTAKKQLLEE